MHAQSVPVFAPPVGGPQREEIGRQLQATLAELIDLSLVGKQLHWAVVGPLFRPLHEQFDEIVDVCRSLADTVAERAVALGVVPDGHAAELTLAYMLPRLEPKPIEDHVAVREIVRRLAEVAERTRERMIRVGQLDVVSQDVLIQVVRELEKQIWMCRAQLSPGGG